MIILLSPAKTLVSNPPIRSVELSQPIFIKESEHLIRQLKKLKKNDIQSLFNINLDLTNLNYERFQLWDNNFDNWDYAPAILTFIGEVFRGLNAKDLDIKHLHYAQDHLRILSGLFGILKPLDNIRPYRLEMGIKLSNRRGGDLYSFWKKTLTSTLRQELKSHEQAVILNLASKEYFSAIDFKSLKARVINFSFKDFKNGEYKFLTVYGKNARGKMARFIIENKIENPEDLKAFDYGAYNFNSELSDGDNLVFTRG